MKNTDIYTQNLVFRLIMIVAVPIFSLIIVYNIYTFFTLTQSTLATGEEHAVKLQAELDEKTALIDSYIINEAVSNDFSVLCYSSNLLNRNISLANIINRFGQKIQDISEIAGLLVTNHQFNWWFDFSPPKGYITTRPTGRCHKHFYWSAIKRYY